MVVMSAQTGTSLGARPIFCCTSCSSHSFQWLELPAPSVSSFAGKLTSRAKPSMPLSSIGTAHWSMSRPSSMYWAALPRYGNGTAAATESSSVNPVWARSR